MNMSMALMVVTVLQTTTYPELITLWILNMYNSLYIMNNKMDFKKTNKMVMYQYNIIAENIIYL